MRRKTSSLIVAIALHEPAPAPPAPMETTLPDTASSSPRLALMGLALVAGGLLLGRKTR
ncbi:MAG TPA: LPXTG cell wall anchor domain-containing protein [Thermoanaerobaculia bacterium]|nr:LPXTG cell wall anchor domain-containing protein [Thermoanaerobaculia bacterium]